MDKLKYQLHGHQIVREMIHRNTSKKKKKMEKEKKTTLKFNCFISCFGLFRSSSH